MFTRFLHRFIPAALVCAALLGLSLLHPAAGNAAPAASATACELVVLAQPDDPYYPLAEEIAAAEGAPIAGSVSEALACQPVFLLWVVSPGNLSDAAMIDFGLAVKQAQAAVSPGIITASTLAQARELWARRDQVRGQELYAINAANTSAHIDEGRVSQWADGQSATYTLTKAGFQSALQAADYLTFTGHGSNRYLRLDDETVLAAADLPALDGIVVSTGSCQTVRPWQEDSIALSFIDQGAAAYAGFVYSPNEGYLIGEFDRFPFRYTWPDFPIGHVIQAQNRGALQGFALFPFHFLLGDPRIALQSAPPYQLAADYLAGAERILELQDVPSGLIPIRVSGGASYHFVRVAGGTSAADGDRFYNSRLQMVNVGEDKFILLDHPGGALTLRLSPRAPWYWFGLDFLLDSLDYTYIFTQQSGGDFLALAFALIPLAWTAWQAFKKRLDGRKVRLALAIGLGAAALQAVYTLLRLGQITITSKTVVFSPFSILATLLLSAGGVLMYLHARRLAGKIVAFAVITFSPWAPMLFGWGVVTVFNELFFRPEMGAALYNNAVGWLPAGAFAFTSILFGVVLYWATARQRGSG